MSDDRHDGDGVCCHSALRRLYGTWYGTRWMESVDCRGCGAAAGVTVEALAGLLPRATRPLRRLSACRVCIASWRGWSLCIVRLVGLTFALVFFFFFLVSLCAFRRHHTQGHLHCQMTCAYHSRRKDLLKLVPLSFHGA